MVTNHLWLEMRPNKWLKYVLVSSCGITDITNTSTFVGFFNYLFLEQILSQIINPFFHHPLGRKAGLGMQLLVYFWVNVSLGVLTLPGVSASWARLLLSPVLALKGSHNSDSPCSRV